MFGALRAAILAAFFIAGPAHAAGMMLPPAEYDRPYKGRLTVRHVPLSQMARACGGPAMACAYGPLSRCTIILPNDVDANTYALLKRHELSHCNGWPGHHPRPRYV